MTNFQIIQGGMGVGVSGWPLAKAVSITGQLGVVAGTALATVFSRRLQLGDCDGHLRRALQSFPIPAIAARVLQRYFIPESKQAGTAFMLNALPNLDFSRSLLDLTVVANFAEVFLAKEGHAGVIGLNLLEKIQLPTLASLYGAMLAGVDYVLMGAGIPKAIPGALDRLARGEPTELNVDVAGALADEQYVSTFDPQAFLQQTPPELQRPGFFSIVSSSVLAATLARKSSGRVDGFVVEGAAAGGHNAPPRGPLHLTAGGEPIYGPRDQPEIEKIRALGLPFWLAGAYGRPGMLNEAVRLGASGIQVGTAFAFCEESGIRPELKAKALELSRRNQAAVFTDPLASPTGFPLKVLRMAGTASDPDIYQERTRTCDMGYLRRSYRRPDGTVGYRCPGEPVEDYIRKGGTLAETVGRKCICNGLTATIGLGQIQPNGTAEIALITAGEDIGLISGFIEAGNTSYSAADVVGRLLLSHEEPNSKL